MSPSVTSAELNLKPGHAPVRAYYDALARFKSLGAEHEGAVRDAFQDLLKKCCSQFGWTLVPERSFRTRGKTEVTPDGALVDEFHVVHGWWEAKDEQDILAKEVRRKLEKGYPQDNILFQSPGEAILIQNGVKIREADITDAAQLVEILRQFFTYHRPEIEDFEQAVEEFKNRIPDLGQSLKRVIEDERKKNQRFVEAFNGFAELCRHSINPNLRDEAVEEMLIQHLLTERIFRKVFNNPDFTRRNVIAAEIEKVVDALTSRSFNRDQFLGRFDHFYKAIEAAAQTIEDFSEKQKFLNTVYEKFFQGFSVKVADTHGIVYTPDAIVRFMVRSVEELLKKEFGRSLSSPNVHIIDPFVGTGNFIVHIMREIKTSALQQKYKHELHCNEVMLLPYYIASMNIEHEYFEKTASYEPFEGMCFVDTFEISEPRQPGLDFMTAENTARVERQKKAPIFVVIGNPPYNMGQVNENDANKNRKYPVLEQELRSTYVSASTAQLHTKIHDPYVKAIRWASSRIGHKGIVALVTNSSFVDHRAFDGMRYHLAKDFQKIYVLDLGGNIRKNPKLSGTTHNVFGIQVGVCISLLVRNPLAKHEACQITYFAADEHWRKERKYQLLNNTHDLAGIQWRQLSPDVRNSWLASSIMSGYDAFLTLAEKGSKSADSWNVPSLLKRFSLGVVTNRDAHTYSFQRIALEAQAAKFVEIYRSTLARAANRPANAPLDDLVDRNNPHIKWTRQLEASLKRGLDCDFSPSKIRESLYRPFCKRYLYYDSFWNEEPYQTAEMFPHETSEKDNRAVCLTAVAAAAPFHCLIVDRLPNLHLTGDSQCFPFFVYSPSGLRRENITDWGLDEFRSHYKDKKISKWDIFHYIYALLHHPAYRERYAANLRRELPRIPFAPEFRPFAEAGRKLADLHVNYEQQPEYPKSGSPCEWVEKVGEQLDWRVEKMRLSKDKTSLIYNHFLTLKGIPPQTYDYRLGNRSALEWVVDQYQVSTDKRSGIVNDPNREDDPKYIVRLIGQVITVSLETVKLVSVLPDLGLPNT